MTTRIKTAISDNVYKELYSDIANGVFTAGDKLGIEVIAKMKGVSHMPVRQALQRMNSDGLVDTKRNCGVFVKKVNWDEACEMWAIRLELETLALKWMFAKKHKKKLVSQLKKICHQYKESETLKELLLLDMAFHKKIIESSGSSQLCNILEKQLVLLNSFYFTGIISLFPDPNQVERSYQEHWKIIDYIEKGCSHKAIESLRFHIKNALSKLEETMNKRQKNKG